MTGIELRTIREAKKCTREQFAVELKGCTAQAIVKWERDERPIPAWVEEKLLRSVEVTLPLAELAQLLNAAVTQHRGFEELLVEALREWLTNHPTKPAPSQPLPLYPTATHDDTARVAEDETLYGDTDE
jgi:transcriptional regulator with XRE-family HTH domain